MIHLLAWRISRRRRHPVRTPAGPGYRCPEPLRSPSGGGDPLIVTDARRPWQPQVINTERKWLQSLERAHGRPLRVLHIGNIANNAYNNAKIQRARGIEADVLCFDYYHVMACPEWEDADFAGDVGDPNLPDWWAVELRGFRRPRWFVQGPLDASVRYLLARTAGRKRNADRLWQLLEMERWLLCRRSRWRDLVLAAVVKLSGAAVGLAVPANGLIALHLGRRMLWLVDRPAIRRLRLGRAIARRGRAAARFGRTAHIAQDADRHLRAMKRYRVATEKRCAMLFAEIGRCDPPDDLEFFYRWWWHPYLPRLLRRYDIVQCYATYTAIPFVVGKTDYVAYEHGTLRSIPFEPTAEGRMCLASYRGAAAIMITNIDNLDAAERMQLDAERVCCLPHAFDSDKLLRFARDNPPPRQAARGPVMFFTPTRQHWVDGDPGWGKGNDRVFRAMRRLRDEDLVFRLRAVAWGNDLAESRELAKTLDIDDLIDWVPTRMKRQLWAEYLRADCVIDQFLVPALGGVGFEAMMLARPVITAIDEVRAARFFGKSPPLFACGSVEEIAAAMRAVITDPAGAAARGAACREWMQRYHSADRIVDLQLATYRRILDPQWSNTEQAA